MCHGGHLVGRPPHRQTWALRVPTLISCYSGLVYIIDAPFRLQDRWIHMLSHSQIGCWLYASLYLLPGFVPHFPHADSQLSYRPTLLRVPILQVHLSCWSSDHAVIDTEKIIRSLLTGIRPLAPCKN